MKLWELTFRQNKRRVKVLNEFISLVKEYFANSKRVQGLAISQTIDPEKGKQLRSAINLIMSPAAEFIKDSGVSYSVVWINPQGGYATTVDLISNMFNLNDYGIPKQKVVDVIEQAIGAYNADYTAAKLRTFNPLFWIGKIAKTFGSYPFKIAKYAGFDAEDFAKNMVGKGLKLVASAIGALMAPSMGLLLIWIIRKIISHVAHGQ